MPPKTPPTRAEGPQTDPLPGRLGPNGTPVVQQPPQRRPSSDPLIGVEVGDGYAITSKLAEGGMGALYVATQRDAPPSKRRWAIKVLLPELMDRLSPHTREDIWNRFQVEAKIALRLEHPHVIDVIGWGQLPDGTTYIKMELLRGKNLRQWAADRHGGFVPADDVLRVMAQVCGALEQAHRLGVVHRDLKPENIFVCETDDGRIFVKLLDFGIAKVIQPERVPGGRRTTVPRAMGTPGYWSPEQQFSPGDVDHRADLYALAVIVYELLASTLPTAGSLAPANLPPTIPPQWYEPIVEALASDPARRQDSVRDFLNALIENTRDGAAIAIEACPSLLNTPVGSSDSTTKAPAPTMPGQHSVPPPAPPLPPSTLAHAAGAYATQIPRRGRGLALAAAALGGAAVAGAIAFAVVSSSATNSPPPATAPAAAAAPRTVAAPSSSPHSAAASTSTRPAAVPPEIPTNSAATPPDSATPATPTNSAATPATPTNSAAPAIKPPRKKKARTPSSDGSLPRNLDEIAD